MGQSKENGDNEKYSCREFLTGFQKRKLERKARARKEVEDKLMKERKAIKSEVKSNFFSQFKKSFAPIPELEAEEDKEEEYEDDEVKVKIVELSTSELARENNWIGENRAKVQESSEDEEESSEEEPEEAVPGMSVLAPKEKKKTKTKASSGEGDDKGEKKEFKTKKELTRVVRDQTSKMIKQCKAFKMKNRLDMMKDRRKARGEKRKKIHLLKKQSKKSGGKHKPLLRKQKGKRGGSDRDKK